MSQENKEGVSWAGGGTGNKTGASHTLLSGLFQILKDTIIQTGHYNNAEFSDEDFYKGLLLSEDLDSRNQKD